jgi:hypothetical protein
LNHIRLHTPAKKVREYNSLAEIAYGNFSGGSAASSLGGRQKAWFLPANYPTGNFRGS